MALNGIDTGRKLWLQRRGVVGGGAASGTPFCTWYLGTRQGPAFLHALEQAMVGDGSAAGLAVRAQANAARLRYKVPAGQGKGERLIVWPRRFDDPPLGVNGPALHATMDR